MTHTADLTTNHPYPDSDLFDGFDAHAEESIADDRAGLRPAEVVQRNLLRLLPSVPVSCLHTHRDVRR